MDWIRGLRVQVKPWKNPETGTISEAPPKVFGLPPVRRELSIAELAELIVEKFQKVHKPKE